MYHIRSRRRGYVPKVCVTRELSLEDQPYVTIYSFICSDILDGMRDR